MYKGQDFYVSSDYDEQYYYSGKLIKSDDPTKQEF